MTTESQSPAIFGAATASGAASVAATTSLAGRYARALFDLVQEQASGGKNANQQNIDKVSASLDKISLALQEVNGLRARFASPILSRDQAVKLTNALAKALALDEVTRKFLGTLAVNRRLGSLTSIIAAFKNLRAHANGQVTVTLTSVYPLGEKQLTDLNDRLVERLEGRKPLLIERLDTDILGGLIIDIDSQRFDSSIRTRLHNITQAMKG